MQLQRILIMWDEHFHFVSWEKKEKGLDYKKNFPFLNKTIHFLHFKSIS